jgi:CheY-like chemotaxis protein
MRVHHPGGAATSLNYVPRNISREGVGLLHSSFMYPGTRCEVYLPHPSRGQVQVGGTIVRCRHFRGKIHEIGVRFDQPIDIRDYLGTEGLEECYMLENVEPDTLSGGVLLVEPGDMDRALIRQHLKETNLTVTGITHAAAAIERAREGYDIILCALDLPDGDGLEVLHQLRDAGIQTPFLLLCSSAGTAAFKHRIRSVQPEGVICKPVPAPTILAAIGELLLVRAKDHGAGGAAIFSSLSPKDPLSAHIPEYVKELQQLAQRLAASLAKNDLTECARLVFQIRGSAPTFGYGPLADAAEQAHNSLRSTQSAVESTVALQKVLGMCHRARAVRAAA